VHGISVYTAIEILDSILQYVSQPWDTIPGLLSSCTSTTKWFAMHFNGYPSPSTFEVLSSEKVSKYCIYFSFTIPGLRD
jgi:hypothetical protein